jgi:15-cis-phytoene synthase
MNHQTLFRKTCLECSQLITQRYSTSFSTGIKLFSQELREPIYAIYGFVRWADEIVDTFHDYPKAELLARFKRDTQLAIDEKISLNPVLESFQQVVHAYGIEQELIDAFLHSMELDLENQAYDTKGYEQYIYGSAEVVGLMCLRVFCKNDQTQFDNLKESAKRLGAAFQKINFLRDIKSDYDERGRVYFPGIDFQNFDNTEKKKIESEIQADFTAGLEGIKLLPKSARFGVYVAYKYYMQLFEKIKMAHAYQVAEMRIRVSDKRKAYVLFSSALRNSINAL